MKSPTEVNAIVRQGDQGKELQDEFSDTMEFLLEHEATSSFIEIGVKNGESFSLWANFFTGTKIAIDVSALPTAIEDFSCVHGIVGSSHSKETVQKVKEILGWQTVDWLFIDGDHGAGVKNDYRDYRQFVKQGGFIGFHDIKHRGHKVIGEFWKNLEGEKVEMGKGCGIGIICKDE